MSALRFSGHPARCLVFVRPLSAAMCALALGGCSTRGPVAPNVFAWSMTAPPARVAAPTPSAKAELEDDGVPVQDAPSARIHQAPDDPAQPWSRNYGVMNGSPRIDVTPIPDSTPKETMHPKAPVAAEDTAVPAQQDASDGYPAVVPPPAAAIAPPVNRAAAYARTADNVPRCYRDGASWRCTR
jgi:hypothetical protein